MCSMYILKHSLLSRILSICLKEGWLDNVTLTAAAAVAEYTRALLGIIISTVLLYLSCSTLHAVGIYLVYC